MAVEVHEWDDVAVNVIYNNRHLVIHNGEALASQQRVLNEVLNPYPLYDLFGGIVRVDVDIAN